MRKQYGGGPKTLRKSPDPTQRSGWGLGTRLPALRTSQRQELQLTSDKGDQMTLRTYCLRGDKVLNVPNLFSRVDDHTRSIFVRQCSLFFYFISQSGGSVTSLQVLLARKIGGISFMQYVAFDFAE